ncbi:DUF1033 family protein [Sporosarcina siberiensis]|uniref:DUF1033 family protein n=1 Tax=Sporosarcina siberiensis TaxID=1365606 RepID=A0ABW4SG37_9BACL
MYEFIYMKAEFEPWWMFEDWEDTIIIRETSMNFNEVQEQLREFVLKLREKHEFEAVKKECFYAFWSSNEQVFCEACDDDLQTYHGLFILKDGQPVNLIIM